MPGKHFSTWWTGYSGIVLVIIFWYINWGTQGLRTHWAFFPLWLGYILCMDAIAVCRRRPSMINGNWSNFCKLFLISIPVWWLFEWLNDRAEYWIYVPEEAFSPLEHTFWSTICFSTVVPAVLVTANALLGFKWFHRRHVHWRTGATRSGRLTYFGFGILLLAALLIWPEYGMASMWISLFFIISPVNVFLRRPAILKFTADRDWRLVLVLFTAALICGIFWEMWNMYAWPKWLYTFPYLDQLKIFEMPAAGYLGYLPFGLDVWALTALVFPDALRQLIPEEQE